MRPSDYRRIYLKLADDIPSKRLSKTQKLWLSTVFHRIGRGEDANSVLGLSLKRGQKRSDGAARQRLSLVMQYIACLLDEPKVKGRRTMSLQAACEKAMVTIVPASKALYPSTKGPTYDAEYLSRCWYAPEYAHMRSETRSLYDADAPDALVLPTQKNAPRNVAKKNANRRRIRRPVR
jgi:hypothetical protein